MALATYSDLKSALADYLARSDLTDRIPDFIKLAEARLTRAIRSHEMQTSGTIALSSGAATLPTDYEEWISCRFVGTSPAVTQDLTFVEADSPEWIFRYRPNGYPRMFSVIAGSIEIRPTGTGSVKLYYYQSILDDAISLSDSVTTNWLLDKAPDLYLNTSLAEAHIYLKDEPRAGEFLSLAKAEADKKSIAADASKFKLNPSRPADTGVGTVRPVGGPVA